ncbi:hypothetical protein MTR67_031018 [Solanum verrucosum]|uniref:Uncharacterized protein n=1 Tax=Solanum verrucosum TaxID=315347 RepID=A0AAF0U1N5_SOLVR|nr:hypothetical protein MTR67_031018 [Solanum verrucosum]
MGERRGWAKCLTEMVKVWWEIILIIQNFRELHNVWLLNDFPKCRSKVEGKARDTELVLLGRESVDVKVDIDLGREGRDNKISRRQADKEIVDRTIDHDCDYVINFMFLETFAPYFLV